MGQTKQLQSLEDYKPKSMYANYIYEREGKYCEESEIGFATYTFGEDYVYIEDLYVKPEYRKSHEASRLADNIALIAKQYGKNNMIGSVCTDTNKATESVKVLLAYGFYILNSNENMIYLKKEI